jgi:hypothetical protein
MRPYRYRISLSVFNVAIALAMSAIGAHEYQTFRQLNPSAFYEGRAGYVSPAQLISYCINVPAFVFANLIGNARPWRSLWGEALLGGYIFHEVSVTFYLSVVLLWWWIGWRIDVRTKPNDRATWRQGVCWSVGTILSLMLAYSGASILRHTEFPSPLVPGGRAIPFAMLAWGLSLLCYFSVILKRSLS